MEFFHKVTRFPFMHTRKVWYGLSAFLIVASLALVLIRGLNLGVDFTGDVDGHREHINYARLNWLADRWNLDDAQANIFVWGGAGSATGNRFDGSRVTGNAGAQVDYETRRIYASLKTDLQRSSEFSDRIDTLQLGVAPYKHDYGGLATWFVFQARHYTGDLHSGIETAALLRLFKGGAWIEAGVTNAGKVQAMAMFNF